MAKALYSELLQKPEVPATILMTALVNTFGTEVYEWEPETLWMEVQDELKTDVPEFNKNKIQALISAVATERFYEDCFVFENISKALNDEDPAPEYLTPLNPEEAAWGVFEVLNFDSTPNDFSEDVKAYIRESLRDNGFLSAPEELKFCEYEKHYPMVTLPSGYVKDITETQDIKKKRVKLYLEYKKKLLDKFSAYL